MIEAQVIRDSISDHGVRLLTLKLRYPKFIHQEFLTHRVFSRNASSSRAVPTAKLLQEVRSAELRASPVSWGSNQKGMQAGGELFGDTLDEVKRAWNAAAYDAAYWAEQMMRHGAHKQVVNRLLEPFSHINVVVSATEWMNFFGLRLDKAAQPEMRALAEVMWKVFNESVPIRVGPEELFKAFDESTPVRIAVESWHLPFVDDEDKDAIRMMHLHQEDYHNRIIEDLIKVSVARCARISYESFDTGKRSTVAEDIVLHDRLLASRHLSPFEHVATPDEWFRGPNSPTCGGGWVYPQEHGNFVGWRQRRKQIDGESVAPLPAAGEEE